MPSKIRRKLASFLVTDTAFVRVSFKNHGKISSLQVRVETDREQERAMRRFAGSCRFVYNKALAMQKENYAAGNQFIGYVAMAKHLTEWRNGTQTPWLKAAPCHPLQHALKNVEKAYKNFFEKRANFPRFKRNGSQVATLSPRLSLTTCHCL